MPYKVLKYHLVDDEIEAVIKYYESISFPLGLKVETEILASLKKLTNSPHHYLLLPDKVHRRISIEGFPYMLVYEVKETFVLVKILFPQKDDPAKLWERLLGE